MKEKIEGVAKIYQKIYELLIKLSNIKAIDQTNVRKIWGDLEESELDILLSYIHINVFNLMELNMANSIFYSNKNKKQEINSFFLRESFNKKIKNGMWSYKIEEIIKREDIDDKYKKIIFLFLHKDKQFDEDILKTLLLNVTKSRIEFAHKYYRNDQKKVISIIDKSFSSLQDILTIYVCFSYHIR